MDEQEGDERKDTAPFPVQPETTEPMMVASPDAARESQEMEAASSMEAEAGPKVEEQGEELAASENMSPTDPAGMPEAAVDEPLVMAPSEPVEDESVTPEPAPGPEPVGEGPTLTPVQERRAAAAEGLRRGRLPQGDVPEDGGNEPAWYVIHCYSGYENKVRHNLEQRIETMGMKDRIFDVVIPTQEEISAGVMQRFGGQKHWPPEAKAALAWTVSSPKLLYIYWHEATRRMQRAHPELDAPEVIPLIRRPADGLTWDLFHFLCQHMLQRRVL